MVQDYANVLTAGSSCSERNSMRDNRTLRGRKNGPDYFENGLTPSFAEFLATDVPF
jgi:hypothetical protein